MIKVERAANATGYKLGRFKVMVYPRVRSRWLTFERQPTFIHIGWGHPRRHAWWARMIYLHWEG